MRCGGVDLDAIELAGDGAPIGWTAEGEGNSGACGTVQTYRRGQDRIAVKCWRRAGSVDAARLNEVLTTGAACALGGARVVIVKGVTYLVMYHVEPLVEHARGKIRWRKVALPVRGGPYHAFLVGVVRCLESAGLGMLDLKPENAGLCLATGELQLLDLDSIKPLASDAFDQTYMSPLVGYAYIDYDSPVMARIEGNAGWRSRWNAARMKSIAAIAAWAGDQAYSSENKENYDPDFEKRFRVSMPGYYVQFNQTQSKTNSLSVYCDALLSAWVRPAYKALGGIPRPTLELWHEAVREGEAVWGEASASTTGVYRDLASLR